MFCVLRGCGVTLLDRFSDRFWLTGFWLVLGEFVCSEKASNRHVLQQTAKMSCYWLTDCGVLVKFQHAGNFHSSFGLRSVFLDLVFRFVPFGMT
jgi:hypothetical protein